MHEHVTVPAPRRTPWNKGKLTGAKPPLRPKHVWAIRTKLQVTGRKRDLALFNLAIDSKLRGCDLVSIKVEDIAPRGYSVDRSSVRQKKTGHPVKFELTEATRQSLDGLPEGDREAGGRISLQWPTEANGPPDNAAVCAAALRVAHRCWFGSATVRNSLPEEDQSHSDLQEDGQSPSRPTPSRSYENRKHRPLSRHRGGRCNRHS